VNRRIRVVTEIGRQSLTGESQKDVSFFFSLTPKDSSGGEFLGLPLTQVFHLCGLLSEKNETTIP